MHNLVSLFYLFSNYVSQPFVSVASACIGAAPPGDPQVPPSKIRDPPARAAPGPQEYEPGA